MYFFFVLFIACMLKFLKIYLDITTKKYNNIFYRISSLIFIHMQINKKKCLRQHRENEKQYNFRFLLLQFRRFRLAKNVNGFAKMTI